jgi:hypothetical protein
VPKPTGFNVVVAATNLNPSIFTQLWLVRNNIFEESDIQAEVSVFSPLTVNVVAPGVSLTVVPDRLQLGFPPSELTDDIPSKLKSIIGKIASELPHTPFQAIGFNMGWILTPERQEDMGGLERRFFLNTRNPLARFFKDRSSHFGSYLSKDFMMGRLKLDIKPVSLVGGQQALQAVFNFHLDLTGEDKVRQIQKFLDIWKMAHDQADEMVTELGRGWSQ